MADEPSRPQNPAAKPKVFKPRAGIVRKSKAERDEYARLEAERAAARAAAAEQANTKAGAAQTARTERKITRDNKQRDGADSGAPAGAGVFGAGSGYRPSQGRRPQDVGRTEMLEGQEAFKVEGGVKGSTEAGITGGSGGSSGGGGGHGGGGGGGGGGGAPGARSMIGPSGVPDGIDIEEETDLQPTRDIEHIYLSDDDDESGNLNDNEDEDSAVGPRRKKAQVKRAGSSKGQIGLRPVRAQRNRVESDKEHIPGGRLAHEPSKGSRVVREQDDRMDEASINIVADSDINTLVVTGETDLLKKDPPSSPEIGKKKMVGKASIHSRDPKLVTETAEERAERKRLQDDIENLKRGFLYPTKITTNKKDDDNDLIMDDVERQSDAKLFLFQLPPLVPFLADAQAVEARPTSPVVTIKKDPDASTMTEDLPTNGKKAVVPESSLPQPQMDGILTADEKLRLPTGRVGKLRIHKSGKISLDWGGTDMEVRQGTNVDFLQDVILVDTPAAVSSESSVDDPSGHQPAFAYALGQVEQKLVVIPDWQKLYD